MAVLKIKVYLAQDCADSRAVFEALPEQLMGRSCCVQYWQVQNAQAVRTVNRFECEQWLHVATESQALSEQRLRPSEVGASLAVQCTPTIELQDQVFTGAQALAELGAYLQQMRGTR